MKKIKYFVKNIVFLLLISCVNYVFCDTLKIYENLVQCYRSNLTEPWMPNNLQVLLELIRKVEDRNPTSLDIRTLSVSLVHKLRVDGIQRAAGIQETEFVTPYDVSGSMRSKMELLLSVISEIPGMLRFEDYLSPVELCTLHKLISSTVDPFRRGDEHRTCMDDDAYIKRDKLNSFGGKRQFVISGNISPCPVEAGVIRNYEFGTLSPGTLIASIAAGLQPQMVPLKEFVPSIRVDNPFDNLETMDKRRHSDKARKLLRSDDKLDNTYGSNLAGDLAEVCVYQAPYFEENVSVGSTGYWNDTEYPIVRFLSDNHPLIWSMTDSEILAGIDGFHLGSNVQNWVNRVRRTRLSQIIEMYYSAKGIPTFAIENANRLRKHETDSMSLLAPRENLIMENAVKSQSIKTSLPMQQRSVEFSPYDTDKFYVDGACDRQHHLHRIPKDLLKEQTFLFGKILQTFSSSVNVGDDLLKRSCNTAVDRFFERAEALISALPKCRNQSRQPMDLTLVLDGSRNRFDTLKLISYITEIIDVGSRGSQFAAIHGETGEYLVHPTKSIVLGFDEIRLFDGPFPSKLSLTQSLSTIIQAWNNELDAKSDEQISGLSRVVLVVSQQQRITTDDFDHAKRLIDGAFKAFPDCYFVFLTNDVQTFRDMTNDASQLSQYEHKRYKIIESHDLNPSSFPNILDGIPRWLHIPPECDLRSKRLPGDINLDYGEFEDYVGRDKGNFYKINIQQLMGVPSVRVQFQGVGYGAISVCMTRNSKEFICQSTMQAVDDLIWFNVTDTACDQNNLFFCAPITFRVELETSTVKCSENDCRYPDQVRYKIRTENGRCRSGSSGRRFNIFSSFFYLLFIYVLHILL